MRRTKNPWILAATLLSTAAWAQEKHECIGEECFYEESEARPAEEQPGRVETMPTEVTVAQVEPERYAIRDEIVGIKPQAGTILYKSPVDDSNQQRLIFGLTADWNMRHAFFGGNPTRWALGPSVGIYYSHLGSGNSDFFGAGDGSERNLGGGANMLLLPLNFKVGYNLTDSFRISAHGGGNMIFRSKANSMNLGADQGVSDTLWKMYPNAGADFEIGLTRSVALLFRPDFTIAPEKDIFTGTVGISASLG